MQDNKLITFMARLSKKEMRAFSKYISNIHSTTHIQFKLIEHIRKYHPIFKSKQLDKNTVFKKIYGEEKSENIKLLMTEISKLRSELKRFLIWYHQGEFPFEANLILLQLYKKNMLNQHVESHITDMKEDNEKAENKDIWYWFRKMRLAHEHYYYIGTERIDNQDVQINEAMKYLDLFNAAAKLQYGAEIFNRNQILEQPIPDIKFLKEINQKDWDNSFLLHHSYQLALNMISKRDEYSFLSLKEILLQQSNQFHENDQQILLSYSLNHIFYLLKKGDYSLVNEAFTLYQYGIKNHFFISDSQFENVHFENIIDIACKLKKFDWVENFLKDWQGALKTDTKEDIILLAKANICFAKKEFEKTIDLLNLGKFKTLYGKSKFRMLRIAAHYERNEPIDFIENLCKAFDKNIRENTLMNPQMKKGLLNFSKTVKKLLKQEPDKTKLKKTVKRYDILYSRFWLLEKINELK